MMDAVLLKFLLAHFATDFLLQPGSWVVEKEARGIRSGKLYLHVLVYGALNLLLIWDKNWFAATGLLTLSHLVIDAAKLTWQKPHTKRAWFFADQAMHFIAIFLVWYFFAHPNIDWKFLNSTVFLLPVLSLLFLTMPVSIAIKTLIAKWTPGSPDLNSSENYLSLKSAGKYIGIAERILVYVFVLTGNWSAVGFLITAKSVFRFGDLRGASDLKLTEYILIGTLLSFGTAILTAMVSKALL